MRNSPNVLCFDNQIKDETIKFIKVFLNNYKNPEIKFKKIPVTKQIKTFKSLLNINPSISDSIFIFGGHGISEALIVKNGVFYDEKSFGLGPKCLFAFCCDAGKLIGPNFANTDKNSFLGFNSKLSFDDDKTFIKWLEKAFYPAISEMFNNNCVTEKTYTLVISELKKAFQYYAGKHFWRAMCLGSMIESLKRY